MKRAKKRKRINQIINECLFLSLLTILIIGCGQSHHQIGSTHIAALSVIPWEDIQKDLSPKYNLAAKDAANEVLPDTMAMEQRILDYLKISMGMAYPAAGMSDIKFPGSNSGTSASQLPTTENIFKKENISKEPMLKYLAGTSLFQEVKLIEHCISYAANTYDNRYKTYVIRLQISLLPKKRGLPYDTYINISFFNKTNETINDPNPIIVPLLVTDSLEGAINTHTTDTIRQIVLSATAIKGGVGAGGSLDKTNEKLNRILGRELNSTLTLARVSDNTLRVRLGAMYQPGTNLKAKSNYGMVPRTHNISVLVLVPNEQNDKEKKCKKRRNNTDNQINKLSIISKSWFVDSNGKFIHKTKVHRAISVLPVCKDILKEHDRLERYLRYYEDSTDSPILEKYKGIVFKSKYNDLLLSASNNNIENFKKTLKEIIQQRHAEEQKKELDQKTINDTIETLRCQVSRNSEKESMKKTLVGFHEELKKLKYESVKGSEINKELNQLAPKLWTLFTEDVVENPYQTVDVTLPKPSKPTLPPNQSTTLVDNGKTSIAMLYGGKHLNKTFKAKLKTENNTLYPPSIEILLNSTAVKLSFPSLKSMGLAPTNSDKTVRIVLEEGCQTTKHLGYYQCEKDKKQPQEDKVSLSTIPENYIITDKGTGAVDLQIAFSEDPPPGSKEIYYLKVVNARINENGQQGFLTKENVGQNHHEWTFKKSCRFKLTLNNLRLGDNITIYAYSKKTNEAPVLQAKKVELRVLSAS